MSEQETDRREEILNAALEVFAENGFHKATIKQIARQAGLKSPALIYWYFDNKEALLQALVGRLELIQTAADPQQIYEQPPEIVLRLIAGRFFHALKNERMVQMFRLFISESARNPEIAENLYEGGAKHLLALLVGYLQHQIDAGTLRPHDPQSGARMFMGMLLVYLMAHEIVPPMSRGWEVQTEEYAEAVVTTFLNGLRAT